MSTSVLDRAEALQRKEESRKTTDWQELVVAYVDDDLPAADKVAHIFKDAGKGRKELERDAGLLREYREEEKLLATVPQLQAKADELGKELSAAIQSRELAESALRMAQERVVKADGVHTTANNEVSFARNAEYRMRSPHFDPIKLPTETSQALEVQRLANEVATLQSRLDGIPAKNEQVQKAIRDLDREKSAVDGNTELSQSEKAERMATLSNSITGYQAKIPRIADELHTVRRDLADKRRELNAARQKLNAAS